MIKDVFVCVVLGERGMKEKHNKHLGKCGKLVFHRSTRAGADPPATGRNSARVQNIARWCVTADETVHS